MKPVNIELKKKFMNDEFVFPKSGVVEMFCDDAEGVMKIITTVDGDLHFIIKGVNKYRNTVRLRMSGSSIDIGEQLEITRT